MSTSLRRETPALGRGEDPAIYALRFYVQFLQGLFNFMPDTTFHWEPDDEISEIVIRAQAPLDLRTVGKRPALTVILGPYQYMGIGLDNMLSYKMSTGERTRTDLLSGHLIVYCLGEGDIIPMRLAHLVSHHTRCSQRLLESAGGFHQIARPAPAINSPSPPRQLVMGDPEGLIMVQVNIPFQLQWTWKTSPKQNPSKLSIDQITKYRRASEYKYEAPETIEHITLAMSTTPVRVRKISGRTSIAQPLTVHDGIENFQISGLEAFQTEE